MTPAAFHATYGPTADLVHAGTGIAAICLEAQWANETGWATSWAGAPYNLGNIRNGPGGSIITYPSLDDFALAAVDLWHSTAFINNTYPNGFDPFRTACIGAYPQDQLAQIIASPWSSGHYGGDLNPWYLPLEALPMALDPNDPIVIELRNRIDGIWEGLHTSGVPNNWPSGLVLLNAVKAIQANPVDVNALAAALAPLLPHNVTLTVAGTADGKIS